MRRLFTKIIFIDKSKRHNSKKDKIQKPAVEEEEEEQKPSWASIAKGPTKPEVIVNNSNAIEDTPPEVTPVAIIEESEVKAESVVDEIVDQIQEEIVEQVLEQTIDEAADQVVDHPAVDQPAIIIMDEPETPVVVIEEEKIVEPVIIAAPVVASATSTTIRKPTIRRLNQTEPVILPNNQQAASLSSVNVQFGSLNLTNGEEVIKDENEEAVEETAIINAVRQAQPQEIITEIVDTKVDVTPSPSASASAAPASASAAQVSEQTTKAKETPIVAPTTTTTTVSNGLASFHNTNKPLPQPFQPQQQQPPHIQPQQQPIQPQPIQQHLYNDPYTMNPYATYVPNVHNSVAGYTGGLPTDYYGTDPQRMVTI